MFEQKVTPEVARREVESWMDFKKVSAVKREEASSAIEAIVDAVIHGTVSINPETFELTQTLLFPLGGEAPLSELVYKARITQEAIAMRMKNAKSTDAPTLTIAIIGALTSKPTALMGKLDTADSTLGQSIAVFFV